MKSKEFTAGFGVAVANLARDHDEDVLAGHLLDDSGFKFEDFENCGLEEYDLGVIRALFVSKATLRVQPQEKGGWGEEPAMMLKTANTGAYEFTMHVDGHVIDVADGHKAVIAPTGKGMTTPQPSSK